MHEKAATLYEEKKLDEALKIYEDIIKLNPVDEVALSCVMDIYLEKDDKFNKIRYYSKPLVINKKEYYLCSQWFETPANNDRPYLLKWLEKYI